MKTKLIVLFIVTAFMMKQGVQAVAAPLYQVTVVQTAAKAINYRNLKGSVDIDFNGTVLLPGAKGFANIKNRAGVIEVKAEFENLTLANQFGPEYLTYILWAISPDGRATNLGELIIKDGKSQLNAKVPFQTMSLLVSAEPYFAVSQPSNAVILENAIKPDNNKNIELVDAKYELLPRGEYIKNITPNDFQPPVMKKSTPFMVYQARNAVKIAAASGAEVYAAEGYKKAVSLLVLAEEGNKKGRIMTARETVQCAEDSRSLAVKRQADEALSKERQQAKDQISSANSQAAAATEGQSNAENAQAKAEQAKGQSDAERAAALALATNSAAESVNSQADAKASRLAADKSKAQADAANNRAQAAEGDKAVLRAQLLSQLNAILQTQDTARGLIVNMSGALFKTGSSELMPPVREKLAKISGIISSNPGLKLSVEGHTDSVGSDELNQRLSEKRAQSARDYLVSQGVPADSIVSRGFGKNNPIESNDTSEGRQKNRRIEIVVSGENIGTQAMAK